MMIGRPYFLTAALLLAPLLFSGCGKYEEETYEVGYKGEARYNPLLAADRLLQRFDYETSRSNSLSRLPDEDTTMIIPAESVTAEGSAKRLHDWVDRGGHLIYLLSGYERHEFTSFTSFWSAFKDQEHPLLEEFGLSLVDADLDEDEPMQLRIYRRMLEISMPTGDAVSLPDWVGVPDVLADGAGGSRLFSLPVSSGRFTVIASAYPLRNRQIEKLDHGRLIVELVELHASSSVLFIYGKGTTFLKMLFHYAWMPLLGLAVLTVLWIWKNLPRFGPVIPQIDGSSRQFTEHIEMSGRFLWRHKASAALLAPLVTYLQRTVQSKHPHLDKSIDSQIDYFVENTNLSRDAVSEALMGLPVKDPASMTRIVRNLKLMTESI